MAKAKVRHLEKAEERAMMDTALSSAK